MGLGRFRRVGFNTAGVAQLAEHDVANVVVEGSNPFARSYETRLFESSFRLFEQAVFVSRVVCGRSSVGRARRCQCRCRGFEPLRPLLRGFSCFGHGFRWKQLVPNIWHSLLIIGRACVFRARLFCVRGRLVSNAASEAGKFPSFPGLFVSSVTKVLWQTAERRFGVLNCRDYTRRRP